ncbi:uncharacterized protein LOC124933892 [Impatiens glandulifera]|uniref:uncharacterized protein LOC124933892 n=1 Tax=Impatiens glandulifera TaxID=253017 RepID=UPI001FB0C63B|nr:uncharacterized protein LOC124933892 [Impatiens glandulifera]XP_047330291.1 uncharacterized protein LOC124933892 [Impatiens glandulifera]
MASHAAKPSLVRNFVVRFLFICVIVIAVRFTYLVTVEGESCYHGDFCFFTLPKNLRFLAGLPQFSSSAIAVVDSNRQSPAKTSLPDLWSTNGWKKTVDFYSSVFQELMADGYLSPSSKSLCLDTPMGQDVFALKEVGVLDAVGIDKKASKPLVISGRAIHQPFNNNTFDFIFFGLGGLDGALSQGEIAAEVARTLKPEGHFVVLTSSQDTYSLHSFISLFSSFEFIRYRDIKGFTSSMPRIREIVMKKDNELTGHGGSSSTTHKKAVKKCSLPSHKKQLFRQAEPLIKQEPLKPWITLKKNLQNIKYLSSMTDINFKRRYVYVDVGSRSYGSSIVSWFKKQYPKQNKTFEIYAIEADKAFHDEYKLKKGVTLLPYAAWVKNESLFFEVNHDPGREKEEKEEGRGMGRIKTVQSSTNGASSIHNIQGFDFADWLKNTVSDRDFVVMKMDVEGTEFNLIPRLFETGAICLIDEIFLECHYNRWQKCCPGKRSPKYEKTYDQCLQLFTSLRQSGVLVHQWW